MKNEAANKVIFDKIKNILLTTALNLSQPIYTNFNMALSRNIQLYCSLKLEDYNNLEMGIGLCALENIQKHQEIMSIPIISGLNGLEMLDIKTDQNLQILKNLMNKIAFSYSQINVESNNINSNQTSKNKNQLNNLKYEKMLQTQSLMWQIIVNSLNNNSYNYDLVNSFPREELTQPIYFSKEIINKIASMSLKLFYSETISAYKYIYDFISREGIFEVNQEQFLWAYNNTLSRKISIIDYHNSEEGSPIEFIAPILEYVNHSSVNNNVIFEPDYDIESKNSLIRVYATKDINKGDQLLMDYNLSDKFNNRNFMNRYGFFDHDNINKNIEIPFLMEEIFEILQISKEEIILKFLNSQIDLKTKNIKKELLRKAKVSDCESRFFKLTIYENKFDIELLKFLRITFLEDAELDDPLRKEKCFLHDFSKKFSDNNEKLVLEFCKKIFDKYYSSLNKIDYDTLITSIGKVESKEAFMLKNMYLLEKEEKGLLEKNLKFISKKKENLI